MTKMNLAHSSSSFKGSCVIQPRHPKTRLPTSAIERKSFDFTTLNSHRHGSSDDTSCTSSNENRKTTKKSQIRRTKSSKRANYVKRKPSTKSISKSVSVGCEPHGVSYSRFDSKRMIDPKLIDPKLLSVDNDLFFRHLQALKEENKRALNTLERLYRFGQGEQKPKKSTISRFDKGNSDEGITSDSNISRNSPENEHANGNDRFYFKECYEANVKARDQTIGKGAMLVQPIEGNYVHGFNGDGLLKVTENRYSSIGPDVEEKGRNISLESGYGENDGRNSRLGDECEFDRRDRNVKNGFNMNDESENTKQEMNEQNIDIENGYHGNEEDSLDLVNGYDGIDRTNHGIRDNNDSGSNDHTPGRKYAFNVEKEPYKHPQHFNSNKYMSQINGDYVTDMDRITMEKRERLRGDESSDDELDKKLKVKPPTSHINILPDNERDFRGRQSNYDVIANMWNNFSVTDTVPYTRNDFGRSIRKKEQGWSPTVTVQEPFKMTIREDKLKDKKQQKIERIKDELLQKKLEEEAELKKRPTPIPIPPSTFLPIFSEKTQLDQQKKQQLKHLSKHILKSTEKPFSFLERENAKNKVKRSQSMNAKIDTSKSKFKASPYPDKLFDLTWKDKEAEQAEYRKIKIKLRSQELLASSSLPPSMKTRGDLKNYKKGRKAKSKNFQKENKKEETFHPQVSHDIPDFQEMQKKIEMALEARKNQNTPTICEPFNLHTAKVPSRRSKFNESVEKSSRQNSPPRPGSSFTRSNTITGGVRNSERRPSTDVFTRSRSTSISCGRSNRSRSISPVYSVTEAARLRQEHIRQSVEKEKRDKMRQSVEKKQKQKEASKLQKVVAQKTAAHDPSRFREKETAEKLASFRQAEKERAREYKEFLRSVEEKNEQRPLLFERESQTNAKRQAQKRYEEILRRAGIDGKTLEAFIAGDRDVQRRLSQQITKTEMADNSDKDDEDITLKSDGMGYDVVLKSNNNSQSFDNISDGENTALQYEDVDDEEEDDSDGTADDDNDDYHDSDVGFENCRTSEVADSDDGSYKAK